MKKIKILIKNYFGFSKVETNGFLVLMTIMILITPFPYLHQHFYVKADDFYEQDKRLLDSLAILLNTPLIVTKAVNPKQVNFDPNKAPLEELIGGGLPQNIAYKILNYRNKGGSFRYKQDLLKIYGFTDSLYFLVESKIELPVKELPQNVLISKEYPQQEMKSNTGKKEKIYLDINTTDSLSLVQIKGIGPKLSSRIVKYRNSIGGYVSIEQLGEVYGLLPEIVEELKNVLFISEGFEPQKIDINHVDFQALSRHPYFGYQKAKIVINYRNQHGNFSGVNDLKKIKLLTDEEIAKFEPYLSFNN
jgi:competence protein ComEA